jgi:archaeal type IV pilus assembly protein PilA
MYLIKLYHISSDKSMRKIWDKSFLLLKSSLEAFTPVIGTILLLLITFALVGIVVSSAFDLSGDKAGFQPQMARITLESCKGGLFGIGPMAERVALEKNRIVLVHEGGSPLPLDSTSIRISGYGNSYRGIPGYGGASVIGNLSISYLNISAAGKNPDYETRNLAVLKDGFWSAGEKLMLCGQDSSVSRIDSSVNVNVNGIGNTSDNYGFKAGSEITLKVIDSEGKNVIAEQIAVVNLAT